jgi:hypothetical protein
MDKLNNGAAQYPVRFTTAKLAREFARSVTKRTHGVLYVVESADRDNPDAPRFVVDTDGFTRSWERSIATYENGKLDKL